MLMLENKVKVTNYNWKLRTVVVQMSEGKKEEMKERAGELIRR
jgi:hypothetical protein